MDRSQELMDEVLAQLQRIGPQGRLDPALKDALLPDRREVTLLLQEVQTILFPRFFPHPRADSQKDLLARVHRRLREQVALALPYGEPWSCDASCVGERFLLRLPATKELLYKDIQAIYDGDPAARTAEEIVLCYPGFFAALIYRLAHELYRLNVPLLPRIMTEYAHQLTGTDIHPGAVIGD